MKLQNRVHIIIPCFNEEKVIKQNIKKVLNEGYSVLVIDDGSTDNSIDEIKKTNASLIRHSINLGQGAAIETGLAYLRQIKDSFDFAITYDGDGQHSVADIAKLLKVQRKTHVNVVLGNRFGSNTKFNGGRIKEVLLKTAARLSKVTIGVKVHDRHNGLRLFDKEAVLKIRIKESGYAHADEILRLILENDLRYCEAEVQILYSTYSKRKGQPLYNALNIMFDKIMVSR